MNILRCSVLSALLACGAVAQSDPAASSDAAAISAIADAAKKLEFLGLDDQAIKGISSNIVQKIEKKLKSPELYNKAYQRLTNSNWALSRILKDLHLKFVTFDSANPGDSAGLGVEYAFEKSIRNGTLRNDSLNPIGISLNARAKGNVAFDQKANPNDFLESGFELHMFGGLGGLNMPAVRADKPNADGKTAFDIAKERIVANNKYNLNAEEAANDPDWQAFMSAFNNRMAFQTFWDVAANASLESNQSFSKKQWVYGGSIGLNFRDWRDKATYNILDYPFAAVRLLTGADKSFAPSGQALPSFIVGLDAVDPTGNPERLAVDPDDGLYPRFNAEAAFKTKVARINQEDLWFSGSYRYFQEIDPTQAIRNAEMDHHRFFAIALQYGIGNVDYSITYANGKLPLDRKADSTIGAGLSYKF